MANKPLDDPSSPRSPSLGESPVHLPRVVISSKPREFAGRLGAIDLIALREKQQHTSVIVDMTNINKARMHQLLEPFKAATERIEMEEKNLESLKIKKSKLKNKLIDVYHFLLKNPNMIL